MQRIPAAAASALARGVAERLGFGAGGARPDVHAEFFDHATACVLERVRSARPFTPTPLRQRACTLSGVAAAAAALLAAVDAAVALTAGSRATSGADSVEHRAQRPSG
jgi:hypothetical protein